MASAPDSLTAVCPEEKKERKKKHQMIYERDEVRYLLPFPSEVLSEFPPILRTILAEEVGPGNCMKLHEAAYTECQNKVNFS